MQIPVAILAHFFFRGLPEWFDRAVGGAMAIEPWFYMVCSVVWLVQGAMLVKLGSMCAKCGQRRKQKEASKKELKALKDPQRLIYPPPPRWGGRPGYLSGGAGEVDMDQFPACGSPETHPYPTPLGSPGRQPGRPSQKGGGGYPVVSRRSF